MMWRKYKGIVIIFACLGVFIAVYFLVIARLVTEIENKRNKLQEMVATQESQQKRLSELPQLKKDFEMLDETEKKIQPFLKNDKAVELIQEVEQLAESTGNQVAIEVATPDTSAKNATKGAPETVAGSLPLKDYIQLKIKITGSFFSFLKLLNKLENSNYSLDVISLQVSRNTDTEEAQAMADVAAKNPFSQSKTKAGTVGENSKEVVSLINVVVYTQN